MQKEENEKFERGDAVDSENNIASPPAHPSKTTKMFSYLGPCLVSIIAIPFFSIVIFVLLFFGVGGALGSLLLLAALLLWPLFAFKTWAKRILGLAVWATVLLVAFNVFVSTMDNLKYPDAISIIGNLRHQLLLYQYEQHHLPGVTHNAEGLPIEQAPLGLDPSGGTSYLGTGFLTQTFRPVEDASNKGVIRYEPAMVNTATNLGVFPGWAELTTTQDNNHFAKQIDSEVENYMGRHIRPDLFQYWSPAAGVGDTNVYAYAMGCFGDGNGHRAGTGYAELEIFNGYLRRKEIATWRRYCSMDDRFQTQICFVSSDENPPADSATALNMNYCWVPSKSQITTKDPKVFDEMLMQLRCAGWELERDD